MADLREKIIVKNLIEEISNIDAINLELVGTKVVSHIEGQTMVHHGLNKDYTPVGYTIDAFSNDGCIAIQCSTEKTYFEAMHRNGYSTPFPKIESDINKAIAHSQKTKKIYLISSQEEPPSFRKQFNECNIWNGITIEILDARELAKHIYAQSVKNSQLAIEYGRFFPDFHQRVSTFEYYGRIPPHCNYYCSEPLHREEINHHYEECSICVVSGLSGAGKTQAAIDYSHSCKNEFDNILWIAGDDWKENTSLSSIQRSRVGCAINVSGIFNSSKTLLIIDSLERDITEADFQELTEGFSRGSRVLITSQRSNPHNKIYTVLHEISENTAQQILPKVDSDSNSYSQFIERCKFLPIILTTAREIIENESVDREELFKDILNNPQNIENKDGKSILSCILERLDEQKRTNLQKLFCNGIYFHDQIFVDSYLGITARRALQKIGILKISHLPNILYTHDIIGDIFKSPNADYGIIHHLGTCIEKNKGNITPTILREIHILQSVLQDFYLKGNPIYNWETYALLQIDSIDNSELAKKLATAQITSDIPYAKLLCIIDANELISLEIKDKEEKNRFLLAKAQQYEDIANKITDSNIKLDLWHHAGKCYRKTKNFEKAIASFGRVLQENPQYHVSLLQIMMIGTQDCPQEIKEIANEKSEFLIECILQDYKNIPLRISLEAISHISSYNKIEKDILLNRAHVEKIKDILLEAAIEGINQFYKAFYQFTSLTSYQYGDILLSFVDNFLEIFDIRPESIDRKYCGKICEAFTNLFNSNMDDERVRKLSSDLAILFANHIVNNEQNISPFIARILAKTYNSIGNFSRALEVIEMLPEEKVKNDHWLLYRKAESELRKNDPAAAHITLAIAYRLVKKDKKGRERISIYERMIAKCLFAKNENKLKKLAFKFYKRAIEHCNNEKFKAQLLQEQSEISNSTFHE